MTELFSGNEKILRLMFLSQGDTELHNHDFLEMVYVTEGKAFHTLNQTKTAIEQGDYFIIDYGAFHKYTTSEHIPFKIINILFKPEFIDGAHEL